MTGTFLGVLFIAMIGNGLIHWGIDPDLNKVVRGIIIFLAVVINSNLSKLNPEIESGSISIIIDGLFLVITILQLLFSNSFFAISQLSSIVCLNINGLRERNT